MYTKQYCEENVWHLCKTAIGDSSLESASNYDFFAVFISNPAKCVPLWMQKVGEPRVSYMVLWDYHVIFLARSLSSDHPSLVFDLDTVLPYPCDAFRYVKEALRPGDALLPRFRQILRVVPAQEFLIHFASDRSHMLNEQGEWLAPPPSYPCIQTKERSMNLLDFISMRTDSLPYVKSQIWSVEQFVQFLQVTPAGPQQAASRFS